MKHALFALAVLATVVLLAGCGTEQTITGPSGHSAIHSDARSTSPAMAGGGGSPNGHAGDMPAYYDSMLFTINFREFPPNAEKKLLAKNPGINTIYQYDPGLPGGQPFISVIDAIPTDGMNPLWEEFQLVFAAGVTPHQFFSDDAILAAQAAGEITLVDTEELYRCSVVGSKPK